MPFNSILALEDGTIFYGEGFGSEIVDVGEIVFNTSMSGYQEIITDPSYKKQIITFTHPHIGNTGINIEDYESEKIHACVMTLAHRSHRLPYRLSKRDSRIRRCYGGYQLIWKALVNNNSLVFFHLSERRSKHSELSWGRSLSIGLEDGSSGSVLLLRFLGGLSSSLVRIVWE